MTTRTKKPKPSKQPEQNVVESTTETAPPELNLFPGSDDVPVLGAGAHSTPTPDVATAMDTSSSDHEPSYDMKAAIPDMQATTKSLIATTWNMIIPAIVKLCATLGISIDMKKFKRDVLPADADLSALLEFNANLSNILTLITTANKHAEEFTGGNETNMKQCVRRALDISAAAGLTNLQGCIEAIHRRLRVDSTTDVKHGGSASGGLSDKARKIQERCRRIQQQLDEEGVTSSGPVSQAPGFSRSVRPRTAGTMYVI